MEMEDTSEKEKILRGNRTKGRAREKEKKSTNESGIGERWERDVGGEWDL